MGRTNDWCILRTSAARTLALAESLRQVGLEAWTPVGTSYRRVMRGHPGKVGRPAPIAPSFVFVRGASLPAILRILADPLPRHPPFSLFRYLGAPGYVSDGELAFLRAVEERDGKRARRARKVEPIAIGTSITMDGAWTGLPATVEASDHRSTTLRIGGLLSIKVETCALRGDGVAHLASAA